MRNCHICSNKLLSHIRPNGVYFFCPHCWQEMPDLDTLLSISNQRNQQIGIGSNNYASINDYR